MTDPLAPHSLLLPADYELLNLLRQAHDLLSMVTAAEEDSQEEPDEPDPWQLPEPIAGGLATDVLTRLAADAHTELSPHTDTTPSDARLYAPDGHSEHMPLRLVPLDPTDRDLLADTLQACRQALDPHEEVESERRQLLDDLRDVLEGVDLDAAAWPNGAPIRATDKLVPLARICELVTQQPDEDTQVITAVLARADGKDVVLNAAQEAAYQRVAYRLNATLTGGSPVK